MKIMTVKDDVFGFAQKECDAAIIWMRSGFNLLHSKWMFEFFPNLKDKEIKIWESRGWVPHQLSTDRIWINDVPTLIQITPPLGKLQYLYMHPNKDDARVSDQETVKQLTIKALCTICKLPIKSCCMNGIQSVDGKNDAAHAEIMHQTVNEWVANATDQTSMSNVYLVDLVGGFDGV